MGALRHHCAPKHLSVMYIRSNMLLQKSFVVPKAPVRRSLVVRNNAPQSPTPVPVPIKDRVRIVEIAAGRSAILGLFAGTVIENLAGISFVQQWQTEKPIVAAVVATMALVTALPNLERGITKPQVKAELGTNRMAMVFMVILFGMEFLPIWNY